MRTSSNPAFRNLPTGGYAGFNAYPQQAQPGYPPQQTGPYGAQPAAADNRPMTIDDVVTKTGILLGTLVVAAFLAAFVPILKLLFIPALIAGIVLGLVNSFKKEPSPALIIAYAACQGIVLGVISGIYALKYDGIVIQAVVGTVGVFAGMLFAYRSGAIKVTPRFQKWMIGMLIGALVLMLFRLVAPMFGLHLPIGIMVLISLVLIGVAAFSFMLDFEAASEAIRNGTPARYAWQIAFGLTVTLIWLYLEILRLLSYLRD
ncbi:Bax inhibitor-1/YccA family protein [Pseudonocardiaceae bacterium YIM PH 21723]|nr:Bax inhibitor-1/YccA family protein [Pseudonocardiaceae bacterium YIM PH 21723]